MAQPVAYPPPKIRMIHVWWSDFIETEIGNNYMTRNSNRTYIITPDNKMGNAQALDIASFDWIKDKLYFGKYKEDELKYHTVTA